MAFDTQKCEGPLQLELFKTSIYSMLPGIINQRGIIEMNIIEHIYFLTNFII